MKVYALLWLLTAALASGCGHKPSTPPLSAAIEGAQRLERRAHAAYSKGDLLSAQKDYQTAATVYASLALHEPLALAQLNLAKIEGESGRAVFGLALVAEVLGKANADSASGKSSLSAETRLLAHGRAAALSLAVQKTTDAQLHVDAATVLCANTCDAASALAVLRADVAQLGGNLSAARAASGVALQLAKTNADKANALRSFASIALAEGGESPLTAALSDADQALAIDQQLGASARVIADLALLEKVHARLGNAAQANRFAALRQAAEAARMQLRLK